MEVDKMFWGSLPTSSMNGIQNTRPVTPFLRFFIFSFLSSTSGGDLAAPQGSVQHRWPGGAAETGTKTNSHAVVQQSSPELAPPCFFCFCWVPLFSTHQAKNMICLLGS